MSREHVVAWRKAPDVDVVDEGDAFHILYLTAEMVHVDVFRGALEQHVDHFPEQDATC